MDYKKKKNHAVSNALSFVVVRNPWDRLRSAYVDKISSGKLMPKHMQADKMNRIVTFTEFVAYVEEYPDENLHWLLYPALTEQLRFVMIT
mmetsp:Transcript_52461/g.52826  ORF Transcript_52461/g.52826 Transcript_52461/m.52826 type:complete len:90 (+) Transcript_52461:179-448(+)